LFFLHLERGAGHVGGGDFTGCKNSHGNDGRRPAELMSRANAASRLGNALLESSDKLRSRAPTPRQLIWLIALGLLALPTTAHASMFHGETLDSVASVIAWFAFIIVPPVLIGVFLLVHILPEKVAEKRHHPQLGAIKCLCLLSLCFGGLLWPIAWLWAYSKPVFHKMAYGTDVDHSHEQTGGEKSATTELEQLRARVAELEAEIKGGKA
jgi:CBS domain containing-hemolysin-like protein